MTYVPENDTQTVAVEPEGKLQSLLRRLGRLERVADPAALSAEQAREEAEEAERQRSAEQHRLFTATLAPRHALLGVLARVAKHLTTELWSTDGSVKMYRGMVEQLSSLDLDPSMAGKRDRWAHRIETEAEEFAELAERVHAWICDVKNWHERASGPLPELPKAKRSKKGR